MKLNNILDSRWISICLLLALFIVGTAFYKVSLALTPPTIINYDWTKHPNVLLISYPPEDCGCGFTVSDWVSLGKLHKLDVLVIASRSNSTLNSLKNESQKGVEVATNVEQSVIKKLSPNGRITAVRIRNAHILRQTQSSAPQDVFFG